MSQGFAQHTNIVTANNTLGMSNLGNTSGTTGVLSGSAVQMLFVGGTNITLSQSLNGASGTITFIGGAGGGGGSDGYNILAAGTQTAATTGTVVFSNSNGLSFGMSNSSVITGSYTVPSTAGLISAINFSAGTTSNNLSNLTFANGNGVSFGLNGSTVTASHNALTSQSNQAFSAQGGSSAFQTLSFGNSNGLSFSNSNGSVVASYTVPSTAGLLSAVNLSAGTTSNNLSAFTLSNSNGLSFGLNGSVVTGSHNGLTSQSNQALSAANGSFTFQTATFANSNGVSFSTGTQGIYATVKTDYLTSQTHQTLGVYALSQTTGQSSSSTFDARTFSVRGAGVVSVGYSAGELIISATAAGGGGNTGSISGGTTRGTLGEVVFSNSNGVSFGMDGQTMTASHNGLTLQSNQQLSLYAVSNTTQATSGTMNASNISFHGAGIASVGVSNGSVVISVPSGGGAGDGYNILAAGTQTAGTAASVLFQDSNGISFGMSNSSQITASYTVPSLFTASQFPLQAMPLASSSAYSGATTTTAGGSRTSFSVYLSPFYVDEYVSFDKIMAPVSWNTSAQTASFTQGLEWGLYEDNAGTLSLLSSWQAGLVWSQSAVTAITASWWWGTNSTSNSSSIQGNISASMSGIRQWLLSTGGSSLTPGNYYLGHLQTRSSAGAALANFSALHVSQSQSTHGSMFGTNVSERIHPYIGIFSNTVSGAAAHIAVMPGSIHSTAITGTGGSSQNRSNVLYFGNI